MVTQGELKVEEDAGGTGSTNGTGPVPTPATRIKARDAAEEALMDELRAAADPAGTVKLSSGLVLKIKPPPQHLVRAARERVPRPEIPVVFIEEKGRDEPNPNHPDYLEAMAQYEVAQQLAAGDVALLHGTAPDLATLPPDMHPPDSDEWIDGVALMGIDEKQLDVSTPTRRYWAWLRFHALRTDEDIAVATYAPMMLNRLNEEDVALAVASFRRTRRDGSNRGLRAVVQGLDGDQVREGPAPAGAGAGGEGGGAGGGADLAGLPGTVEAGAGGRGGGPAPAADGGATRQQRRASARRAAKTARS